MKTAISVWSEKTNPIPESHRFGTRTLMDDAGTFLAQLYRQSRWMTVAGYFMVLDLLVSVAGLTFDSATVDGNPAWLKPLKFAISTGLFAFSIAFILGRSRPLWLTGALDKIMSVALVVEICLIDMQAARHVTSHFNTSSYFDAGVYASMGLCIAVVMICTIILLGICLFRRSGDASLDSAMRLGLLASLIGMGAGILMTMPTPEQKSAAVNGIPARNGSHTVGGPDGGPRMPFTGWSADHGDIRIAHFIGLHAMQATLVGWAITRRRRGWSGRNQICFIRTIAWSLFGLFAITLWQALRGQPFLRPDAVTLVAWTIWLITTAGSLAPIIVAVNNHSVEQEPSNAHR